jgi:CubicO group peptidase (beta-lactamase class C family)
MRCVPVVAALLVFASPAFAQTPADRGPAHREPGAGPPRDLAPVIRPIREQADIPGMAALVLEHDRVGAIGVDGVRERGKPEAVTIDDRWHLGSDTKAMTATLIGMLVDEGTLKWTSTIGEVFADVPMDAGWKAVTLEQLLCHRGGVPGDLHPGGLWDKLWKFKGTPTEARMTLVRGVLKRPPLEIGLYVYSNGGYAIAGAMAERVTGTAWEDLMRERLFKPLGMTSVGFGAPGTARTIDQPRGHKAGGAPVEPGLGADNPVAIGPAGIVHCSIRDWSKFIALHLLADRGEARLLKAETYTRLHTAYDGPGERYAMGWLVTARPWAKGPGGKGAVLTHAGSNTMWYCVAWLAPEKDFAVLVACNQGGNKAANACDELVGALIREREGAKK